MARKLAEALALFATPFVLYAIVLVLRQAYPATAASWSVARLAMLTACGLALVVAGMLALGLFSERYEGTIVPAHLEDGRLVPGRVQ